MKSLSDIPMDGWPKNKFQTFAFIKNAAVFFSGQQEKHGDIYRCNILGHEHVRAHGADFAKMIYKNSDDIVVCGPAWEPSIGKIFPNGLLLKDHQAHITHRRIMQHAFNKPAMLNYFDHIQNWSKQVSDELAQRKEVDFFPFIKEKTLDLALLMFLGINYKEEFGKEIAQAFTDTVAATLAIVRVPVLNNKYHRGIKGRATLHKVFTHLIQERREAPKDDLVSFLCTAKDEDGTTFTNEQIVDHLIFTMMAAHDTTASSLSSVMYFLTLNKNWQSELQSEAESNTNVRYETLSELQKTEWVFKESIRLFPPLATAPRQFNKEVELSGYRIPAGTKTGIGIYSTHRDPTLWQSPDTFDPSRFERKEDKQHPYQYIPFGGGVHKCIGMHLAMMESKLLLASIFSQLTVEKVNPDQETRFKTVPIWQPKGEFKLRFNKI